MVQECSQDCFVCSAARLLPPPSASHILVCGVCLMYSKLRHECIRLNTIILRLEIKWWDEGRWGCWIGHGGWWGRWLLCTGKGLAAMTTHSLGLCLSWGHPPVGPGVPLVRPLGLHWLMYLGFHLDPRISSQCFPIVAGRTEHHAHWGTVISFKQFIPQFSPFTSRSQCPLLLQLAP